MNPAIQQGLPQRLNYRAFIAPGVMRLADGAFLTAYEYHGPDQEYSDFLSMEHLAEQINQDLSKLSAGWMLHAEAIRVPVVLVPSEKHCPEPTSQLVAEEQAREYEAEGKHFETRLVLAFTWLPPSEVGQQFSHYLFGKRRHGTKPSRLVLLSTFQTQVQQLIEALTGLGLRFLPLTDEEIVHFLRFCVTGEDRKIGTDTENLHYAIGAAEMKPHRGTMVGKHYRVVGVSGFPAGTSPQMLAEVLQVPFPLRVSQRFIFLGSQKAVKELEIKQNKWEMYNWANPKRIGWKSTKNVTGVDADNKTVVRLNKDAENQAESVDHEITRLQEGKERGGYYTLVVVVMDRDEEQVEQHAAEIVVLLNRKGFTAVVETDHAPYALRGSWPGHADNVRKPRLTSRHFARLMISSSPWRGHEKHPSPLYPSNSGPLLICKSTGHTPFFFTPRLHFLVIGPNGNGKTVLFNAMSHAHLQYERAQVFTFDNGFGGLVPCLACGGQNFDLDDMQYAPLSHIHQEDEYAWALDFCERLATLRNFGMTPQAQKDLQQALADLSKAPIAHRTMTGLLGQLQTSEAGLRTALSYYAGTMPGAILDGHYSSTAESHWLLFDMEQVLKRSEAVRTAALMAQFHVLDRRMVDGRPTRLMVDEGGLAAGDVILRDFIEKIQPMRKKVVSVGMVLHDPTDLQDFPHANRLLSNIGTYIFLPNPMANTPAVRKHYSDLGLGSRVIKMLAEDMRPRRDYLVVEKEDNQMRRFQLPWGPWMHALMGCNGRDEKPRILELRKPHGVGWLPVWLKEKSHSELAMQWQQRAMRKEEQHAA